MSTRGGDGGAVERRLAGRRNRLHGPNRPRLALAVVHATPKMKDVDDQCEYSVLIAQSRVTYHM